MRKSNIKSYYIRHGRWQRVCQGDILKDFNFEVFFKEGELREINLPYIIILSQDCDLEQFFKDKNRSDTENGKCLFNQFLHNILFLPSFQSELVRYGNHLQDLYNVVQRHIPSEEWKSLKQNKNERYHFLNKHIEYNIPELVIDFKAYYTLPSEFFKNNFNYLKRLYLASISELCRENLAQRFAYYLNRIGLPVFDN